jgi:hypothetical protein
MKNEKLLTASFIAGVLLSAAIGSFVYNDMLDNELKARYSTDVTKKQCVDAINLAVDSIIRGDKHSLETLAASRNVDVRTYVLAANNVGEITGRVFVMNKFAKAYGQEEVDGVKLAQEIKESSLAYCNAIA